MIAMIFLVFAQLLSGQCPEGTVKVPGKKTCIDLYEWPNKKGELPSIAMSGLPELLDVKKGLTMDAEALCKGAGKRVCTASEWISACKGPKHSSYPFGGSLPSGATAQTAPCNYLQSYRSPDEWKVAIRDPAELLRLDHRDKSGARGCISASGAQDMMGNVEEWVRCEGIGAEGWCLAGRFWSDPRKCDKLIVSHAPRWHYYETGFRCCSDL